MISMDALSRARSGRTVIAEMSLSGLSKQAGGGQGKILGIGLTPGD
jgi:hypothetical protein